MSDAAPSPPVTLGGGRHLRSGLALLALLAATLVLAGIFGRHYAPDQWLFWRYLRAWSSVLAFALAALSVGNLLVSALSRPGERQDGQLTLSFATGVYAFFLAIFVVGVLGGLGQVAFFAVPVGLFAVGAPRLSRDLLAFYARIRERRVDFRLTPWEAAACALGLLGAVVVLLPTLVPDNAAYDARWYHVPLAENYALAGAIRRFPEGALAGTVPHLASLLYTWAFLAPGELFDHVVLAAQLEFGIFLFTVAGVPALVRCLVPGARARIAWVTFFLFPSLFVYDSALTLAADHIAALWTIPCFVALLRALRDLEPRACVLLVIQLCGLVMTKYTSAMVLVFPVLAVSVRALMLAAARLRGRTATHHWLTGPLSALFVGLALTTPHWLKNWLWYGDPVYPMLHRYLNVRPWIPDGPLLYEVFTSDNFQARGTWPEKLEGMLHGLHDYSYKLYTWESLHGLFPVFGSLFTFSLFALPFLKATRRLWALVVAIHLSLCVWYLFFSEDRYLQVLLPWMVAGTSAIFCLAWRLGWAARLGVVSLAGLQLVWGTETMFWPTHQMTGKSGIALANDFFGRTLRKDFDSRTKPFEDLAQIGRSIPKGSKLLIHVDHPRLGIGVQTVSDAYRVQYGISYGYLESSIVVHRLLRQAGVTHVLWTPELIYAEQTVASELMFHSYVTRHLVNRVQFGSRVLGELPPEEPPDDGRTVLYYGCDHAYQNGLYDIADLRATPERIRRPGQKVIPPRPRVRIREANLDALVQQASHAVLNRQCAGAPALEEFERVARWGANELMLRER